MLPAALYLTSAASASLVVVFAILAAPGFAIAAACAAVLFWFAATCERHARKI